MYQTRLKSRFTRTSDLLPPHVINCEYPTSRPPIYDSNYTFESVKRGEGEG